MNKIHECTLRLVYNNCQCNFEEPDVRDSSFTIRERNFLKLTTEMFKVNKEETSKAKEDH